jgi:hypothetical protein
MPHLAIACTTRLMHNRQSPRPQLVEQFGLMALHPHQPTTRALLVLDRGQFLRCHWFISDV